MSNLPATWCEITIDQLGRITTGNTPSKSDPRNFGTACPWVKPPDLNPQTPVTDTEEGLSEHGTAFARVLPAGAVLVCCIGSLGKVGLAGVPLATNQQINSIAFDDRLVEARYGFYYCQTLTNWLSKNASATTVSIVNKTTFSKAPFILAPREEQKRIVAEIEKQLTRLDASVAALKRVQANLKRYRASVLKAACEGRLVPTEAELARRGNTRSSVVHKTSKDALPEGWKWATLSELSDIQGGIQKQPSRRPVKNTYPFLRVANVLRGRLDLHEMHSVELFTGELEKLRLQKDDLLIVEGNGSPSQIGRMAIWNGEILNCAHQNHIIRARLTPGALPAYVQAYWNSPRGSSTVLEVASSTSGLYTLSVSKVGRIPIPLPPVSEQARIVEEIDRRLSSVEEIERETDSDLKKAERLRQSILKRAFEGKLVPQDPNDEPAAALLERIRGTAIPGPSPGGPKTRRSNRPPLIAKETANA